MDSLTHLASGALIGAAFLEKPFRNRAMLLGAAMQSLPDIDIVASFWLSPADNLLAHRGITHSFLFAVLATVVLAYMAKRFIKSDAVSLLQWMVFLGVEIFVHLLLDAFNSYGVGWFEPFNHYRIAFNSIFVFDPSYSLCLIVSVVALLIKRKKNNYWITGGLVVSSLYLQCALVNKYSIDKKVEKNLAMQHIVYDRYFTSPTALNIWLWYCVAEDSSGYFIGYRSVFDTNDTIDFHYLPKHKELLSKLNDMDKQDVSKLIKFSQRYYTIEQRNDTLVFNDLRFGQVIGWNNPEAPFSFHYYLQHPPKDNMLVVQRGRFEGWNKDTFESLIRRIKGK